MRLAIGKSVKVNMGNYESVEMSAFVTLDAEDLYGPDLELMPDDPDEVMLALRATATRYLDDYLEPELEDAQKVSQASDSMLFDPLPPPPPPRRMERTTPRTTPRRRSN